MNKLWLLALSNIRKSKGASISLFLITFVAAILLNLGTLTSLNFSKSFDQKAVRMNSAHAIAAFTNSSYQERYKNYFYDYPGVTEAEKEEIIFLSSAKFQYGKGELTFPLVFLNADANRTISNFNFVGEYQVDTDRGIYVSSILHTGGGYELGDEFIVSNQEKDYVFQIAGFTEDIMLGSTNVGCIGFHLPDTTYQWFINELKDENSQGIMLKARLTDRNNAQAMISDFQKNEMTNEQTGLVSSVWLSSYLSTKTTRTSTANIGGVIIIGFSLIIVLVSLLVIKFRVSTSIEDGMPDIGTLKALGYTSSQIVGSIILQFLLITAISAFCGIGLSYLVIDSLAAMFSAQTGIVWKQGFDLIASLLSLLLILLAVILITPLSARKIKKLHPIIALRSGIMTHSFKKNYCPLDRMKGGLNFALAMKTMILNLKQNLMISLIIAAISFTSVFAIVMFYNITVEDKAFMDMIGMEMSSVGVTVSPGEDSTILIEEILKLKGVRKAINYDFGSVTVEDEISHIYITDDYALVENNQVYEGRYPEYDNEVAVNGYMAELFGKKIGDMITVRMANKEVQYLITGLLQSSNFMGMDIALTYEGVTRIRPDYTFYSINIYLEEGENVALFIDELNETYGERLAGTINMQELLNSQLGVYISIVTIFATVILIVTILIVVLILFLIIKAMIIRRRKEFGIQKSLGYTTFQLMTQTSISFLPIILLGTTLGSVIGSIYINPIISVLFKGIGVMKVNFTVPTIWIIMMCVAISCLAYMVSMLVSWRIRKITAYALIVE